MYPYSAQKFCAKTQYIQKKAGDIFFIDEIVLHHSKNKWTPEKNGWIFYKKADASFL